MRLIGGLNIGWKLLAHVCVLATAISCLGAEVGNPIEIENEYVSYVIGADGANMGFSDKKSGTDYLAHTAGAKFARLKKAGKEYTATQVTFDRGKLSVKFGASGVTAVIRVVMEKRYFTLEPLSVSDEGVDELTFLDVPLTCQGTLADKFQCCALALNLKTDISPIPGPSKHLRARCFPRPGLVGAKAAVLACPQGQLRNVMKEAVGAAPDLPHTILGGPWALDAEANRGSYMIDYRGSITEKTVDQWIAMTKAVGARQIDFHTGHNLRFGDFEPDRKLFPRGLDSVKAVIDKLHGSGIAAGLHTYAFFVAKDSKWVTPVPDQRLAKDSTFTLTRAITEAQPTIPVDESTKGMSLITGFQVRNSLTVQIDEELITYSAVSQEPPYGFLSCQRGACGTRAAQHEKGSRVYHLKECFGLFAPDGDSTMLQEVAARTAEVYNTCGFDMIYLDALDGADVLGAWTNGLARYHSQFVYDLCKALKKPAIMEMSTFDHHLWVTRSRLGAWDAPSKAYKPFIDKHFLENKQCKNALMPANLGWWCVFDWTPKDRIRTFPDDVEYIMCKAIAGDHSLSWLMGFEPEIFEKSQNSQRLGAMIKQYEELRLSNYFPQAVRDKLAAPESDFTLEKTATGGWQFRPVRYISHKAEGTDAQRNRWKVTNPFSKQPLKVRIEALLSLAPYEGNGEVVAAFSGPEEFSLAESSVGTTGLLQRAASPVKTGSFSGCFSATSQQDNRRCAWTMAGKKFSKPVNLLERGFGVWIHGDGKGEVLNFQWRAPEHISGGLSEHYAVIDFTGWRYFEFVEPESDRLLDYGWPYLYSNPDKEFGSAGNFERFNLGTGTFWVDYAKLDSLKLWYNNLPKGQEVKCYLSPIKALPHVKAKLVNPSITIGGKTITFPAELESGSYLEFRSLDDCKVYDAKGTQVSEVKPQGNIPQLEAGENEITFNCSTAKTVTPRANITVISYDAKVLGR